MTVPFRQIRETRRARADEAARVVELAALASGGSPFAEVDDVRRWLADTTAMLYVAAPIGSAPLGMVAVRPATTDDAIPPGDSANPPGDHLIPTLVVAPGHRGAGWGLRLLEAAMVFARRRAARRLFLRCDDATNSPHLDLPTLDLPTLDLARLPRVTTATEPPHTFLELDPHAQVDRLAF